MWHRNFDSCISCGTTTAPYMAKGSCRRCYLAAYRQTNPGRIADGKRAWYERNIERMQERNRLAREERNFSGNRQAVLTRDGFRCTSCGTRLQLVVHHKDGSGRGSVTPNNAIENLITLCKSCHATLHLTLGRWSRDFDCCQRCGTTERRHNAKGYCWRCYRIG
jgi:hypothetical protein